MGLRSALASLALLAACDTGGGPEGTAAVVVEPDVLRTYVGDRNARFTASVPGLDGVTFEWSSSDPSVCWPTPTGGCRTLTTLGEATLTVVARDRSGAVVGRGEGRLLSESERLGPTEGATLEFARGRRWLAGGYGPVPLLASSDEGRTWAPVPSFPSRDVVEFAAASPADAALAVVSATDRTQFAASDAESVRYLTEDGGETWRRLAPATAGGRAPTRVFDVAFHPSRRETLYVLGGAWTDGEARALLFETADLGRTWRLAADLPRRGFSPPSLLAAPSGDGWLYVVGDALPNGGGGYASTDGGATWAAWTDGAPQRTLVVDGAGRLYGVRYPEAATGLEEVVRSDDGGRTWAVLFEERDGSVTYGDAIGRDVVALGVNRALNHGHTVRVTFDAGETWGTVPLTPADQQTFARPQAVSLFADDGRAVEAALSFAGWPHADEPGERFRLRLHRGRP